MIDYDYTPDNWVVIKITHVGSEPVYKVLSGWSGGYAFGDAWRLNSGIVEVEEDSDAWHFYGHSGSCYVCGKGRYGMRMNIAFIWEQFKENAVRKNFKAEIMDEDTYWRDLVKT